MAVEFSRNITFGQYLDLDSPIHRLDPRTKLFSVGVLTTAILLTPSLAGLAVILLGAALIQVTGRIPLGYTLRGLRLLAITLLIIFVFQVLFYQGAASNVWWRWGFLSLSSAGVLNGLTILARVLLLYHLTTTLMFTTPLMNLADGMETLLAPLKRVRVPVNELIMTLVVALKFVPLLVGELERLIKAQAARGASLDRGPLLQRARTLGAILVPLFVNALGRAEVLSVAMDARCYRGGQGRTKRRVLRFRRADVFAFAFMCFVAVAAVAVGRAIQ